MRVLLVTLGSHGDIHPFVAVARALIARGHAATVATNPYFEPLIRGAGVGFAAMTDRAELKDLLTMPGAMHPLHGPRVVLKKMALPLIPSLIENTGAILEREQPDLAVVHPICLACRWVCERRGVRTFGASLQPVMWFNRRSQPVMLPFRSETPNALSSWTDVAIGRVMVRWMLDGPLNRARRKLGLPRGRNVYMGECVAGEKNLALWSSHFRGPLEGDPERGVICGFPWFDTRGAERDGGELEAFLSAGEAPVVFTLGTAAVHTPGAFYREAAGACADVGRRGVLLVGSEASVRAAGTLPTGVRAFGYAPYSTLFPRCAAVVHHGGIGTTAQGLRSGRPTVIVPLAHDQFDNAARVARLGVSRTVHHAKVTRSSLARALRSVLDDEAVRTRSGELGPKIAAEDGAARAAEEIAGV
jgi:rhamnosyltransferase subunit B